MKEYKIEVANYVFNIKSFYKVGGSSEYLPSKSETDFEVSVEEQDILKERGFTEEFIHDSAYEKTVIQRKIANILALRDTILFHSVAFDVNGVGVAFAAHSGTGKTTHTMLWKQLLGEKMTIVNGDKPFVRFFDSLENAPEGTELGVPYAYGTPWNGKEKLGCNMRTPLKHICFIERSEKNFVEKIGKEDAINRVFNQVYMPSDPAAMANTMSLINRLLEACNLWIIHCNMDISAAQTAYNAIFN